MTDNKLTNQEKESIMSKAQMEQIEALVLDKDILEAELDCKRELIRGFRWFCLKLSVELDEDEDALTKEVALILLNKIDDATAYMSFDEFIKDQ